MTTRAKKDAVAEPPEPMLDEDTEWVPIDSVTPAEYNPRTMRSGKYVKLRRSIQEFGLVEPLVANRVNRRIIGGHQRYRACKELGHSKVKVAWVTIEDEDREKALNIALNNAELAGEWDSAKLGELLAGMVEAKTAVVLTGFDQKQVSGFIERARETVEAPVYPLAAKMLEHYDYVVVFVDNETDWLNLQTMLELETQSSYKKQKIGIGRVIPFARFYELWERRETPEPRPKEASTDG